MKQVLTTTILSLFLFSFNLGAQVYNPHDATEADILANVESYVQQGLKMWKVPGTAVSIVKDGQLVYAKGFGVKDLSNPQEKVDEHTVFKIASVSKAFTPVVIAQLVDEGKVKWDTKVKDILPKFRMKDKFATDNMRVKDLFCHWSGLNGQSGSCIECLGFDKEDLLKIIPVYEPGYSFRGDYQYNTMFYSISALVVEKISGKSWEQNIQERILDPLGMTETVLGGDGLMSAQNKAQSHSYEYLGGQIVVEPTPYEHQPLHRLNEISAAGAIVSSVTDMSKWLQFQLDGGKVGDRQLVSKKQFAETHKGVNIEKQTEDALTLYGYGWHVEQSAKGRLYWHTGSGFGHTDICGFVPELKLGFMISSNSDGATGFRRALMRRIIDLYLGEPDNDYNFAEYASFITNEEKKAEKAASKRQKVFEPSPEEALLTGTYENKTLGKAVVSLENDRLFIVAGPKEWKHELVHTSGNAYKFESDGHIFPVTFKFNKKRDKIESLRINVGVNSDDFGSWNKTK